jgi:hypothetical protein
LLNRTSELTKNQILATRLIIDSLEDVEVRLFKSPYECMKYFNEKVSQVKKQIDDVTWIPDLILGPRLDLQKSLNEDYRKAIANITLKFPFREVLVFKQAKNCSKTSETDPGQLAAYPLKTSFDRKRGRKDGKTTTLEPKNSF